MSSAFAPRLIFQIPGRPPSKRACTGPSSAQSIPVRAAGSHPDCRAVLVQIVALYRRSVNVREVLNGTLLRAVDRPPMEGAAQGSAAKDYSFAGTVRR